MGKHKSECRYQLPRSRFLVYGRGYNWNEHLGELWFRSDNERIGDAGRDGTRVSIFCWRVGAMVVCLHYHIGFLRYGRL